MIQNVHSNNPIRLAYPRSRDSIRRDAYLLRSRLEMVSDLHFPILHFIENVLPVIDPSFLLEIVDDKDLIGVQAEYVPKEKVIRVRQSVYDAAANGYWEARFTLAHELGHYYYHDEQSVRYAKLDPLQKVPPDFDPERQANVFAAELLAPIHLIAGMSPEQIGTACGVSYSVARRQLRVMSRVHKRKLRKRQEKKKRLGLQT